MNRAREQEVVLLAAAGDRAAAAELVRAHQERLISFLVRMTGRRESAEDIAQEAFVRALRSLSRFDPQYRFSTWLFTIARRIYWNWAEKRTPFANSDLLSRVGTGGASAVTPAWQLANWTNERAEENARQRDALQHALMDLPDEQREVVVLFHQQGWSVAMIARELDLPHGTIKSHLHRGRNRLRESLYKHGWTYDAELDSLQSTSTQADDTAPSGAQQQVEAPIVDVPHARRGAEERKL
jgi:RNA polymerase sigma-70 factor (ECF subfamily)